MSYVSDQKDIDHLRKCFTGSLKENILWCDVGDLIRELCGNEIRASYLGGDLVLFQPESKSMIGLGELEGFLEWFDYIREWNENDVNNRRIVWTKWYGVPLQAWNSEFFSLVASKFGRMERIDQNTINRKCLQRVRVMIRTPYHKISSKPFPVNIDGKTFFIRIKEEGKDMVERDEEIGKVEDHPEGEETLREQGLISINCEMEKSDPVEAAGDEGNRNDMESLFRNPRGDDDRRFVF